MDGFLLTGDTAAFENGYLYLRERTQDMFVSGGENVYPAQIRNALLRLPDVSDAHVFGAPDETWGAGRSPSSKACGMICRRRERSCTTWRLRSPSCTFRARCT